MSEHWAEQGAGTRQRLLRIRVLNEVLGHFGLQLANWSGSAHVLRDRKGRAEVVHDLASLWQQAERMVGAPLDPLAPALVAALRRDV